MGSGTDFRARQVMALRKRIAIILLVVMILPIAFLLKPVFAVDSPQLNATVDTKNSKQVYTVKWEVPGGQYWAQTPAITYTVLYRAQNSDGTYTEWNPLTVGSSSRIVQTSSIKGSASLNVLEADYGKSFQFSLTDNTSLQDGDIVGDTQTIVPTAAVKTLTATEIATQATAGNSDQFWDPSKDTGNIFERIVALLVYVPVKVVETVGDMASFKSIDELVFLVGVTDDKRSNLPWDSAETKDKITQWFLALMWVTAPLYVFVIAYNGLQIMYTATNPMKRSESMESIQRWFFSLGIVIFAPILMALLLGVSGILIDAIVGAFKDITHGGTLNIPLDSMTNISTGSILGTALVKAMFALMYLYFNVIYIVRMTAITVMYAFTPILAIIWAIKKDTPAMAVWMGELASNAFMPVAHGLVICTILLLCNNIGEEGSWVKLLIMLYCLIPLSEVLRNSLTSIWTRAAGMNESRVAGSIASMAGLGGIISLGRVGGAALKGTSMGAAATTFGKSNLNPQHIPNPTRTAAKPPGSSGKFSNLINKIKPQNTFVPNTDFKKTNYAKQNGHGVYARHNWDHKTPKPTATKKPRMSAAPKSFYYKQPETNRHMSATLGRAAPIAAVAASIMTAPMMAMAGAVPGGREMVRGTQVATAGIARGVTTAAGLGHSIYKSRKEAGGNTAQALQRVTGVDTKGGAAWSMAKTMGGSIVRPAATYNNAMQGKNTMDQSKNIGLATRKAKLDARLNPVSFKQKPSPPPHKARVKPNATPKGKPKTPTYDQLKHPKRHSAKQKF